MTAAQLQQWRTEYEQSDVEVGPVAVGDLPWDRCWASDLPRAHRTAQAAFTGPITTMVGLREADFAPFRTGALALPIFLWHWVVRLAWMTSHRSQRAARDAFLHRVRTVADQLCDQSGATLVVSHAGVMLFLRKELLQRGFTGPVFRVAEHARLYVFQRDEPTGV